MELATAVLAWGVSSICRNLASNDSWGICPQRDISAELRGTLSAKAQIFLPGSTEFSQATNRWSALSAPSINIVVVPSVESDVAETVKYANAHEIPYLTVSSGHGSITTLGSFQGGIEIWLNRLSSVEIAADGSTATIGGGTLSKTVTDSLWAQGKQTVTGICECVGVLGPGLGGGHGFLQGRYGLVSDQFVSMNIVLADGKLHTIDEKSDLWWAVQGAGHNFGIVTSVTSKIYDIQYPDWAYESFIFKGDQVENVYDSINKYHLNNGSPPVDIMSYSMFLNIPDIDPDKPIIRLFVLQEGVKAVDSAYTAPFHNLGPISTTASSGSYRDLNGWLGGTLTSPPCQKIGLVNSHFPVELQSYDLSAQKKVYDLFASTTHQTPALNGSTILFEGYPVEGVKAVPSDQTAVPYRASNLLASPFIIYAPSPATPEIGEIATDLGRRMRQILHDGSGQTEQLAYVNYAFGDETLESWYGHDTWRQDRLKALKKKYDPLGKFSYYAPIA
ncbi:FAD-binding domain-containing protein [Astrocystis sublimbata]|nr:FAD-binding domain-containing protein [Astrocystis sublimbata]